MKKNQIKDMFQSRKFKSGSYSLGVITIAVVVVIVINMIVNALPASITKIDLSYNQLYSITSVTEEFVKGLDEDVRIYVMAQTGAEDSTVMEMLGKYQALSGRIKVETIDPVLHPTFITQYTKETVSPGSLVVVSSKRHKIVNANTLYETTFDYNTYSSQTTGFDGEGQITSAIHYVTTDTLPVVYTLEGHNEPVLSTSLTELIGKNGIEIQSLSLYSMESVPEDAACVFVNAPATDISSEEADKLIAYLEKGGAAFIADGSYDIEKPNLEKVLEYYGIGYERGMIVEEDTSRFFYPYQTYLAPEKNKHDITSGLISNKYNVFMPFSEAVVPLDSARKTIVFEPLLTTSQKSFLRLLENTSTALSKENTDLDGPFHIAAAVSEEHGDVETKLVVFGTSYITDESANANVNGSNFTMVLSSLNWMCDLEDSIAIEPKSYSITSLQTTSADVNRWMIITVIILPLLTLGAGFLVWFRRRRK